MNKTQESLKKSYQISEQLMKEKSIESYYVFRLLPKDHFLSLSSLYAFFRMSEDSKKSPSLRSTEEKLKDLGRLKENLIALKDGRRPPHPYSWWQAFAHTIESHSLNLDSFFLQLEGQRKRLEKWEPENLEDLVYYCQQISGSIGRIFAGIFISKKSSSDKEGLFQAWENLGIAMEMTNILRNLGEGLRDHNQLFIPLSLLHKYGLTKEYLLKLSLSKKDPLIPKNFISLWEELAKITKPYYGSFEKWICTIDKEFRIPIYGSALVYESYLDGVRKNNYNCLTQKVSSSKRTKVKLLGKAQIHVRKLCKDS